MATYDHELTLIQQDFDSDEIGNQIPTETRTTVLCSKKSVTRTEFYNAANSGAKPVLVFTVHSYEYNDQQKVEFEGRPYSVIRTYENDFEEIELTCERVIGNGKK
ncbi:MULTISPECIES: phage head closure protein [Bacillus]|uniref:phage head closure protein n=1 Tax=Bacillus TaxID=1386 RepID=UPI0022811E2D|nr:MULTISPECIES: phage head closure protein [Bacillus]MCY8180895.1 phage head closure protein [Bacillus paralicheniformis]MCY8664882.1 phage head closure protein [Bacillus haynesii]MCY8712470.1 phage head closure protein [Bacillus haynesii]